MKPTRGGHNGGTGSAGSSASSSKVKRRPASAVGPVRQLQFTVGPVADDDLDSPMFSQQPARQPTNNGNGRVTPPLAVSRPQFQQHQPLPPMHVAPVYAPVPAPVPMPAAPSVSAPAPQATGGSGAKPMDVDEFDDDDDFLAGPESLMMIEEAEQRYQATQGVAGGGLGNGLDHGMPLVDGDALQQEFDALPDIVLDDTMISDVLTDTQQRGAGGNAAGAGPSAASRSVPAQEVQALRQQLAEAQKRYRDLENTMTSKDGEITTLRRRENQMTGEFNKLKEQLAAAEAAIVTARQEEHAKLQREIEMLRKDVAFMEQEQQKVRRGMPPVASQSAPVGEVSASQVWRATPSKARTGPSSAFAKPAPVSVAGRPPPSPAPPPFRKSMGPSTFDDMAFGPTQVPQQQQQQQFQFPQPVAKPGGTAAVVDGRADRPAQAVQGVVPKFSAVKLRMARMESEARAKEDRRNLVSRQHLEPTLIIFPDRPTLRLGSQFVRELFSDPIFNPTTANKNSTKSSSSLLLPTSFALRPHPTAKVSRDSIARFDAARISLAGILTASVGQKDIPLSSILSPLESFFSSAMEHGDVQLVLFCVRLVKMLVNADEGCRAAILGCNLNSFASQTYNNKNKSGPQPMSVDSDDESDDEAVAASKANTLEQLCRLLRHAAHIVSPNQPGVFSWLAESETHQVATDVLSVLSSITWNRDPKSLNKFAVVFESRWHRYLCLKTQPLKIVSDFVHFCSGLLKCGFQAGLSSLEAKHADIVSRLIVTSSKGLCAARCFQQQLLPKHNNR